MVDRRDDAVAIHGRHLAQSIHALSASVLLWRQEGVMHSNRHIARALYRLPFKAWPNAQPAGSVLEAVCSQDRRMCKVAGQSKVTHPNALTPRHSGADCNVDSLTPCESQMLKEELCFSCPSHTS